VKRGRLFRAAAALLGFALTLSLGYWQLQRAAYKEALQARAQARSRLPELDTRALLAVKDLASVWDRTVSLRGTWLPTHTVYLDNRSMQARVGFEVVTPLRLEGSEALLLVRRGWIPRNFMDRARLAPVETPNGPVQLRARVTSLPEPWLELGPAREADAPTGSAPGSAAASQIRQNLDVSGLAAQTGSPVLGAAAQQVGAASEGLLREWTPPQSGVERHYAYAFQWFALASLIAVLSVWFLWIAPHVRSRSVP